MANDGKAKWLEWAKFGLKDIQNQVDPNLTNQLTDEQIKAFCDLCAAWHRFVEALEG